MTGARLHFGGLFALFLTANSLTAVGDNGKVDALQAEVTSLREQLAGAEKALLQAQLDEQTAQQKSTDLQAELDNQRHADAGFQLGPVTTARFAGPGNYGFLCEWVQLTCPPHPALMMTFPRN